MSKLSPVLDPTTTCSRGTNLPLQPNPQGPSMLVPHQNSNQPVVPSSLPSCIPLPAPRPAISASTSSGPLANLHPDHLVLHPSLGVLPLTLNPSNNKS
ncbi:hypothetical protein DSO57_1019074 [Entomophthora muscae]|uniref:Uncharacterized protein n=1 Tax=Entomophthora muscae TaxID=34485 RepID=A0ACC2SSU3_9FUNG|nr:hypothetical protein DSO57_1019074 [Entomophthora muscae]